jgi:hypothetical protein
MQYPSRRCDCHDCTEFRASQTPYWLWKQSQVTQEQPARGQGTWERKHGLWLNEYAEGIYAIVEHYDQKWYPRWSGHEHTTFLGSYSSREEALEACEKHRRQYEERPK